jgi:hypothetical protein
LNWVNEAGRYEIEDGIAVITVDSPPVNALSVAVRAAIVGGLLHAHADPAVAAIVLICAGRTFIAGADLSELGKPPRPPSFEEMIEALESGPKPVVAAIHGTVLGRNRRPEAGCCRSGQAAGPLWGCLPRRRLAGKTGEYGQEFSIGGSQWVKPISWLPSARPAAKEKAGSPAGIRWTWRRKC